MSVMAANSSKPLDPNAIPFWSPSTLRKSVRASPNGRGQPSSAATTTTSTLSAAASEFVDPSAELESDEIAAMMEEFVLESELADAVVELAEEEQGEADEALTKAMASGEIPPAPVTDDEMQAEGEEFVAANALCEAECEMDPESDPAEGMDEASAAFAAHGRVSATPSEVAGEAEEFALETAIAELEEEVGAGDGDDDDDAAELLRQQEVDGEDAGEEVVVDDEEAAAAAEEAEMEGAAEEFELENAIAEAEEALDPESDPAMGMSEADAMLQECDVEREMSVERAAFELEVAEDELGRE